MAFGVASILSQLRLFRWRIAKSGAAATLLCSGCFHRRFRMRCCGGHEHDLLFGKMFQHQRDRVMIGCGGATGQGAKRAPTNAARE